MQMSGTAQHKSSSLSRAELRLPTCRLPACSVADIQTGLSQTLLLTDCGLGADMCGFESLLSGILRVTLRAVD